MSSAPAAHLVSWTAYPAVLIAGIAAHFILHGAGVPLAASTYLPVILAAGAVTWLEWRYPHRLDWRPQSKDIRGDLLFMTIVQMALPPVAGIFFLLAIIEPVRALNLPITAWWPHHLPLGVQVVLTILVGDFLRYWLHRAAHTWTPLWRLHAVHHSVSKLYWLNVGRFHPFEKVLQLLFDTFPFVLLGVAEQVIMLHFLLYAINGFFQHSNVELRYGWLNYLVGSAETHRWHHSRLAAESNHNYGNNIILWDLVFGTFFLPKRELAKLGLQNADYPMSFAAQMLTPFTREISERDVPLATPGKWGRRMLNRILMAWVRWRDLHPLMQVAHDPTAAQDALLTRIVRANWSTRFGREHDFASLKNFQDFKTAVPICGYEELRPYIDEQADTGMPSLTAARPVLYAQTSGTTGEPKRIPLTQETLSHYLEQQRMFTCLQYQACPEAYSGAALGIAGAAVESRLPSGVPVGSISGHLYACMPRLIRKRYVVPPEVFSIEDYDQRYLVMLRLALAERDITYMAGANPSSFLRLLVMLNDRRAELLNDLESGRMTGLERLSPAARKAIAPRLTADPDRAHALRQISGDLTYANVWPNIRLVTTWTGGSCGIALASLKQHLPASVTVMDLGYLASEMRGTVTVDPDSSGGLPLLQHVFFEFAETLGWDAGARETLRLHEIDDGKDYYLIVTTASGLYRYFMNDIVRMVGRVHATPLLRFVQKGKGVASMTGEKLYESQVLDAVRVAATQHGVATTFFMLLADEMANTYRLYLELDKPSGIPADDMAATIDRGLCAANLEYDAKRASGRLQPLRVVYVAAGTGDRYKAHCVAAGQREGQFKPVVLQYLRECHFPFDEHRSA